MENNDYIDKSDMQWDPVRRAYVIDEVVKKPRQPGLRGWINSNEQLVVAITFIMLIILLIMLFLMFRKKDKAETISPPTPRNMYYNVENEKLYESHSDRTDDPRAKVFQKGMGTDKSEEYIGYLQKPAPGVSWEQYQVYRINYGSQWGKGILVRRPTDDDKTGWITADSPEGRKIILEAYGSEEKCQQGQIVYSR